MTVVFLKVYVLSPWKPFLS